MLLTEAMDVIVAIDAIDAIDIDAMDDISIYIFLAVSQQEEVPEFSNL